MSTPSDIAPALRGGANDIAPALRGGARAAMNDAQHSDEQRRVRLAKRVVLVLACVVGVTLVTAFVFAMYSYTTDRPAKEMFQ
jgi:hypothetical protein